MNPKLTVLSNGFKIITDHIPHVNTATCGVWVGQGARDEDSMTNGISHFLEHMLFKGTKKMTALEIATFIEDRGGYQNAFTDYEVTAYHNATTTPHVTSSCEVVVDMLLESTIPDDELVREREVVVQEIGRYSDEPESVCYDNLRLHALRDQSLGRPILGPKENVLNFTSMDLHNRIHSYNPKDMILIASGNFNEQEIIDLGTRRFSHLENRGSLARGKINYNGGQVHKKTDSEQMHVMASIRAPGAKDPRYYAWRHMNRILGQGMSSRLFQEVREKRGLVYSVSSSGDSYVDGSLMFLTAGTDPKRIDELLEVMFREFRNMKNGVTEQELDRSKAGFAFQISKVLESTMGRANLFTSHMFDHDKIFSIEETMNKVNSVTLKDVTEIAEEILSRPETLTLSTVGPVDSLGIDDVKSLL